MANQVRASHILVNSEGEAMDVLNQLKNGKNFAELAKGRSTCPSGKNGGDLGFFKRGQMAKPFEDAAFSLGKGQTTQKPVKTKFGYHIIKVTDTK
jgi:peptidyl-prolyl cis-trans isomerase C